jgi:hypothetical protein
MSEKSSGISVSAMYEMKPISGTLRGVVGYGAPPALVARFKAAPASPEGVFLCVGCKAPSLQFGTNQESLSSSMARAEICLGSLSPVWPISKIFLAMNSVKGSLRSFTDRALSVRS